MGGSVSFSGGPATSLDRRARVGLGYLAELRSVFMGMTVVENLRVADAAPSAAYEFFAHLERLAHRRTGLLSGGEQQMLALAAVLPRNPALLLADEISLGLAPLVVERLLTAVRAAADNSAGVLLVEQYVSSALRYADYVYVLRRGQVVLGGQRQTLRTDWATSKLPTSRQRPGHRGGQAAGKPLRRCRGSPLKAHDRRAASQEPRPHHTLVKRTASDGF
jgi:branched-chain amino acid transport system ATP-binding protein